MYDCQTRALLQNGQPKPSFGIDQVLDKLEQAMHSN